MIISVRPKFCFLLFLLKISCLGPVKHKNVKKNIWIAPIVKNWKKSKIVFLKISKSYFFLINTRVEQFTQN